MGCEYMDVSVPVLIVSDATLQKGHCDPTYRLCFRNQCIRVRITQCSLIIYYTINHFSLVIILADGGLFGFRELLLRR